jgi:ATP-binding cassette, subfamily B, bacterial
LPSRTRKLLSLYRPYWRLLLADLACAALMALAALALPLGVRVITQKMLAGEDPGRLGMVYAVGAGMLALVAVHTLCNFYVDYQGHSMGARMERDMRQELFDHYRKLPLAFHDGQRTGQLMSRLTNDLFWLAELFHHGPEDLLIGLVTFTGVFAVLLTIHAELTLVIFLFLPLMAVYAFTFNKRMNIALRRSKERIGDVNAQVEDTLAGIRVVQSFANEALEAEKFARQNERFLASRRVGYRSEAFFSGGMVAFTQLIMVAVVVLGAARIVRGSLDLADLVTFLLYTGLLLEPIHRLANFARLYQEGITGFDRFLEMLAITPAIEERPGAIELAAVRGAIEFRNVSFGYQNGGETVLQHLSLQIAAGEYVALVGLSGAGKTTLCSLIPRFYEVTAGTILLDGADIRDIRLQSLRRQIGMVHQDVYLFAGTVADNIRYGKLDATEEEIVAAARQANAHDFIMKLPEGYHTDIGQRGVRLSGGQKQRLSIARAFLKDPAVLILDEATSSLDNESEQAIREALAQLARSRTTIVIAHRLATVRSAGRILVLTENGIEEAGTHEALLARGGAYAALYQMQVSL